MGRIRINKENKNRVLLTDILPYEVPIIFSNEGFYSVVQNGQHKELFDRIKELSAVDYGIPYNFKIRKTLGNDTRTVSVIHPYYQLGFVGLYEKYNSMMIHLCSISPISLRKISKIASFYYSPSFVFDEDPHKNEEVEVEPDILDSETKYLKSYFKYTPIDLIYKFYDRMEFRRLEQRFNYLMTFDISKCFYHIYTHSITWAVKNKESAKRNARKESFENKFDELMQKSNYNETNGIVVGPEISRIFAEIILQRVDVDSIRLLSEKPYNLKYGVDYEVRRFVDDYFLFANDEQNLSKIKDVFQDNLAYYKLYLNHNKTAIITSPFISNIHVAKREVNQLLSSLWDTIAVRDENETGKTKIAVIRKPYSLSQNFIKDFQCIAKRNDLTYDIVSKDVIRFLKGKIVKLFKSDKIGKEEESLKNCLLVMFDVLLYCYSMNINASTTFKVSQSIVLTCKYFERYGNNETKHTIFSKITQDIDNIFIDSKRKANDRDSTNVERLNILLALKKLGSNYLLTEKRLKELFDLGVEETYSDLSYFQIISLLFYIENDDRYNNIRQNVEKAVVKKYTSEENAFVKSELVMMFFDIICCPFVSDKTKRDVIRYSMFCKTNTSNNEVDAMIKHILNTKQWFTDWDINIDLERILKKKEWGNSY